MAADAIPTSLPSNDNIAAQDNWRCVIERLPMTNYFTQGINLPGLSISPTTQPTRFNEVFWPGKELTFDELSVRFLVDEDYQNWYEIWKWMVGISLAQSHEKAAEWGYLGSDGNPFSDITLLMLTNNKNPKIQITFQNCFPTSLQALDLTIDGTDHIPLQSTVSFKYSYYEITFLP